MNRDPLPPSLALPPQDISTDVLREKYLKHGEADANALFDRVARARFERNVFCRNRVHACSARRCVIRQRKVQAMR